MTVLTPPDPFRPERAVSASGLLAAFCDAGVLETADVHVARTLDRLTGTGDGDARELVALAAAFAVRAVRNGSVAVDLSTIASTVTVEDTADVAVADLPWPETDRWLAALDTSPLVARGDEVRASDAVERDADAPAPSAPLRALGSTVALDRYWRHERDIATDLLARATTAPPATDAATLHDGLGRLFGDAGADLQRRAARIAVERSFAVVAGGPGTGKTTTVAAILALLHEQADANGERLRVALAAPTGKAAARLTEAVHDGAARLPIGDDVRDRILATEASTIHRLLGWLPGSGSRFRHDRANRLPHGVVIVDETSMVGLTLMARLVEAVRPDARLVLVGDPQQLSSVEAGSVLGDIVGPAQAAHDTPGEPGSVEHGAPRSGEPARVDAVHDAGGEPSSPMRDCIVVLRTVHRYRGGVGALARAIESGDADAVVDTLADSPDGVRWLPPQAGGDDPTDRPTDDGADDRTDGPTDSRGDNRADGPRAGTAAQVRPIEPAVLDAVQAIVLEPAMRVVTSARAGDAAGALAAMRAVQVLCAHRQGPHGVQAWRDRIEGWLAGAVEGYSARGWYAGRPLLVTENDYGLELFNGDTGVTVANADGRLQCAFERRGALLSVAPSRLRAVETLYAMTIHKSQGSQFADVVVVVPDEDSPILTRELLYTAVTRAERSVTVVGTASAIRAAVRRPVNRASGLQDRLWT